MIHALLVLSFVLSLSLPSPRRPGTTGAGATAFSSSAEPDMTLVFIDAPNSVDAAAARRPPVASRGKTPPDLQLVVLSPDALPAAARPEPPSDDTHNDSAAAEAAEHARLYSRYIGQVQARIERAWLRPRTGIGASQFSCQTRIQQDRRGAVIGISLDHCNGTERWRESLEGAIRTASPLPAPPDASVYTDFLWLSFSSGPFEEGGSSQGFEPQSRLADARDRDALESFRQFADGTPGDLKSGDKESSEVVHLTIIGTPSHEAFAPGESPPGPPALPPPESPFLDPPRE